MMPESAELVGASDAASPSDAGMLRPCDACAPQGGIATPVSVSGQATEPFAPPTHGQAVTFVPPRVEELVPKWQLAVVVEVGRKGAAISNRRQVRDLGDAQLIPVFKIGEPEKLVLLQGPPK